MRIKTKKKRKEIVAEGNVIYYRLNISVCSKRKPYIFIHTETVFLFSLINDC